MISKPGFLGLAAHLGQEFIVSQPLTDGIRGLDRVLAQRPEPFLDNKSTSPANRQHVPPGLSNLQVVHVCIVSVSTLNDRNNNLYYCCALMFYAEPTLLRVDQASRAEPFKHKIQCPR